MHHEIPLHPLFHHDSFGYRPGRNVEMALRRVQERVACGLIWLVDADIRSFFDRIPHRPLRNCPEEPYLWQALFLTTP